MKIIYMGSPEFAVYGLNALYNAGHEIKAVITREDKIRGRKKQPQPTAVKARAMELGLTVYTPSNVNDSDFIATLKDTGAELIIVSAFGRLLKSEILSALPLGVLNIHGSLLPKYRGASPMNAVLRDGESETGITIMYLNEGMDEGDICLKGSLEIGEDENFASLSQRMGELGGQLIVEALELMERGNAPRIPQNHEEATYCQLMTREDEKISWQCDGKAIHNQIRSLSPEPGAYTHLNGDVVKLIASHWEPITVEGTPGQILSMDKKNGVAVCSLGGILWLQEVKPAGKKTMRATDWYRGLRQKESAVFTDDEV
ncbi:MAG: methionyl-tRNA formyltransferase [Bacillota bacterium]|nr:methionyl-tRNA formyltransferase [Bacillota bacterium]